jgi:hypothetical protein
MGDVNPRAQAQQYTPRQTSIVDAVAETKRVVEASLRANPLKNAVVDSGLMRFRGNYGIDFLWIGEFYPKDPILDKPQRAVLIRRDDHIGADVLAYWDWYPDPARPLRQKMRMRDASNRPILEEGGSGGLQFPRNNIVCYPVAGAWLPVPTEISDTGSINSWDYYYGAANSTRNTDPTNIWEGKGSMTGRRLYVRWWQVTTDNSNGGVRLHVDFDGSSESYTSSWNWMEDGNTPQFDILFSEDAVGRAVNVVVEGQVNGSRTLQVRLTHCYSYSRSSPENGGLG